MGLRMATLFSISSYQILQSLILNVKSILVITVPTSIAPISWAL